ncbi:MAG: DUF2156 domain-containing protein [Ruminococcaceae bacterium]|nr:DUF2156 domain-containing protein [Oscillospiraceae bacterium]
MPCNCEVDDGISTTNDEIKNYISWEDEMADFKDIKISDKKWVDEILKKGECPSLECSFTTIFIWRKVYDMKVSSLQNGSFFSACTGDNYFLFPIGVGDVKGAVDEILNYCRMKNIRAGFYSLTEENKEFLEKFYPDMFIYNEIRDGADYIYEKEKLATLVGKKLASKRNHINRFVENNPDWKYEQIDKSNIAEVIEMNKKWCEISGCENEKGLKEEGCAVTEAFENFDELGLSGGLIRAKGEVVAFSMGDRLNDDTFLVHIEKAFADIQGAYPIINREFVIHNCDGYKYVNREDDTGDEGLRKAKLSYRPCCILKKWDATMKEI